MKNKRLERLAQMQREYHRSQNWRLSEGGLFVPHSYVDVKPDKLSAWDDVGFIMNGRRFIVWWQHPRHVYANEIENRAWEKVGTGPDDNWLCEVSTKNYKKVGRSRKKVVSCYTSGKISEEREKFYDFFDKTHEDMFAIGIDFDVSPSWKWERLKWAMGVSLVAPIKVRNRDELAKVAELARKLVTFKTTLKNEFADYKYTKSDFLQEQSRISEQ